MWNYPEIHQYNWLFFLFTKDSKSITKSGCNRLFEKQKKTRRPTNIHFIEMHTFGSGYSSRKAMKRATHYHAYTVANLITKHAFHLQQYWPTVSERTKSMSHFWPFSLWLLGHWVAEVIVTCSAPGGKKCRMSHTNNYESLSLPESLKKEWHFNPSFK